MQAVKYRAKIDARGNIVLPRLKLKKDSMVEVIVLIRDESDDADDLLNASQSSTDFWDNAIDDEVWNNA